MKENPLELLKKSGLKVTKQREAILDILLTSPSHLTAEDIYLDLKAQGHDFGLSTVYRTLSSLEDCQARRIRDRNAIKTDIKNSLSAFLYKNTKRSPMILPVIMEI